MKGNFKTRRLVNGIYWEIKQNGNQYILFNTNQSEIMQSGVTTPEVIQIFDDLHEVLKLLNN